MSSSATPDAAPDFGRLAATYDELRPPDANWRALLDLLVREGDLRGRRVLELGTGTGAVAAALVEQACKVWAVDSSPEMLALAKERLPSGARARLARAEALPFRDGWFERVVGRLVAHLLDRPCAFAEARRVLAPGGRLVLATMHPAQFDGFWLNRFFPSFEAIDRARFPTPEALERELTAAGFAAVRCVRLDQRATTPREEALRRLRGRYISTLHLLPEDEYAAGLERAERELPDPVEREQRWLVVVADA